MMDPNDHNPPDENELKRNEDYQKVIGDLMNNAFVLNNDNNQRNENSRNGQQSLLIKLSKSNEKLKRANRRLKKKIISRQKLLANYEVRLAQVMADLFTVRKELEKLKAIKETDNAMIGNLVSNINKLKSKLLHFQKMKWKNDELDIKVKRLKAEIRKFGNVKAFKAKPVIDGSQLSETYAKMKKIEKENQQFQQAIKELQNRLAEIVPVNENLGNDSMETEAFSSEPSKTNE